jgi:hypothetical protein
MWRQFAEQPDIRFACTRLPTVMSFPGSARPDWTNERRVAELAEWFEVLDDLRRRLDLLTEIFEAELERLSWLETHTRELDEWLDDRQEVIQRMHSSLRWRIGERAARLRKRLFSRP